jgi:glycine cleavage system H protein
MNTPKDLKYTKDHEWLKIEDNTAVIGITDYAQHELGDVVFVELPGEGDEIVAGEPFGTVESVKTVSDLNAPLSGEVSAINEELADNPQFVNEDPYGNGWMIKITFSDEEALKELLSADDYANFVEEEA